VVCVIGVGRNTSRVRTVGCRTGSSHVDGGAIPRHYTLGAQHAPTRWALREGESRTEREMGREVDGSKVACHDPRV